MPPEWIPATVEHDQATVEHDQATVEHDQACASITGPHAKSSRDIKPAKPVSETKPGSNTPDSEQLSTEPVSAVLVPGAEQLQNFDRVDQSRLLPPAAHTPEENLNSFARQLQLAIGPQRYNKWFAETTTAVLNGDLLIIGLNSPFLLNWMEQQFQEVAEKIAETLLGFSAQVRFEVSCIAHREYPGISFLRISDHPTHHDSPALIAWSPAPEANRVSDENRADVALGRELKGSPPESQSLPTLLPELRPDQRELPRQKFPARRRRFAHLQDYIGGASNHVALAMAKVVAEHPGEKYNPFYIYGHVGNGKTHLLEGIHTEVRERFPELTVMYLTAETFANFYTKAIREKTLAAFRRRFRSVDVLLVDDVDFFDAKRGLQEEFCHTIQDLLAYGRQVVLAADRHPKMLTNIRPELGTRFLAGLVTRIETPDETTRKQIIQHQVSKLAIPLSDDAIDYTAQKFSRNVRELMGAIHCLQTYYYLKKRPLGITATREVLRDLERDCLRIVRTADIQNAVCEVFGITHQELVSQRRTRKLVQPRMIAMYLSRQLTSDAYHEIGKQFGGRNHSTVITAERKIKDFVKRNCSIQVATREWKTQEVISLLQERLQVN